MREIRLTDFHAQKGVSLATLEFEIERNGNTKTVQRRIATRCKTKEDFELRLKDKIYCDGVVIVGLMDTDEGLKIPLIREFKEIVGDYIWTFPAGQTEKGEDLRMTALRELKEETGLDTDMENIVVQRPTYTSVGIIDQKTALAILKCHGTPSDKYLSPSEDIKAKLFTLKEIEELLQNDDEIAGNTRLALSLIISTNGDIDKLRKLL